MTVAIEDIFKPKKRPGRKPVNPEKRVEKCHLAFTRVLIQELENANHEGNLSLSVGKRLVKTFPKEIAKKIIDADPRLK